MNSLAPIASLATMVIVLAVTWLAFASELTKPGAGYPGALPDDL